MRVKVMEWQQLCADYILGIPRMRDISETELLKRLASKRLVLWDQVKKFPTAGTIEFRDEKNKDYRLPKKFTGVIVQVVDLPTSNTGELFFLSRTFCKVGKSQALNRILQIKSFEKRTETLYSLRSSFSHGLYPETEGDRVEISDRNNYWIFGSNDLKTNRRLIIGESFSESESEDFAFIDNGKLLNSIPNWISEVFNYQISLPEDLGRVERFRPRMIRKKRNVFNDMHSWRPDMVVRYIVMADNTGKLANSIPLEMNKYCVLPGYCAVEFAEDVKVIENVPLGNSLALSIEETGRCLGSNGYVFLAELKGKQ